ncbi:MAG TPA: hypothetical protein ENH09_05850, partial [Bacteroidetes bacterium]|nr:hypothetical protein [Bacteroidota bacterium]
MNQTAQKIGKQNQSQASPLASMVSELQKSTREFHELHWEGNFDDYLRIVEENPETIQTAFQRIY